jgi:hypothetical protein
MGVAIAHANKLAGPAPKRATLASLNAYIARNFPEHDIELCRGNGYFYFSANMSIPSIMIYALNQMDYSDWVLYLHEHIQDAIEYDC